jgi:hypothetical protein
MDAAWKCFISMHLLLTPCSRLRAEHSASNMRFRELYALRASLFCYEVCTFCISLLAHGLLPCSPVVRASVAGYEIMSMFSGVKVATLCLFDFAKLQRELINCHVKSR